MALAGPLLLGIALLLGQRLWAAVGTLDRRSLLGFAISNAGLQLCLFRAYDLLGPSLATVLTVSLQPVLACGWLVLTGQQKVTARDAMAMLLAIAGLVLLMWGALDIGAGPAWGLGVVFSICCACGFVAMSLFAGPLSRGVPCTVAVGAGLSLTGVVLALFLAGRGALSSKTLETLPLTGESLALVVYVAGVGTALAFLVFSLGMARCRSTLSALIAAFVKPLVATVLTALVLRDAVGLGGPLGVLGCGCLLLALLVMYMPQGQWAAFLRWVYHGRQEGRTRRAAKRTAQYEPTS